MASGQQDPPSPHKAVGSCSDRRRRPSIYIYPNPLPPWTKAGDWRFSGLSKEIRRSAHYTADGSCADFFFLSNQEGLGRSTPRVVQMIEQLARDHPFWNRSMARGHARHLLLSPCDHGPGDCMYDRSIQFTRKTPEERVPRAVNPASPERQLAFLSPNGMPGGVNHHIAGLDVRLPQDEHHQCGPLCGARTLKRRESIGLLRELSPWTVGRSPAERMRMLRAARPLRLFFAGKIAPNTIRDSMMRCLASGPRVLLRDTSGKHQAYAASAAKAAAAAGLDLSSPSFMGQAMARSDFCLSPLGQNEGDSDRYLAAILHGCIPIFTFPGEQPPYADVLPWRNASLLLGPGEPKQLPTILARIGRQQVVAMRLAMAHVWRRLLWTGQFGSYLGEGASDDAFETLMKVLKRRLRSEEAG